MPTNYKSRWGPSDTGPIDRPNATDAVKRAIVRTILNKLQKEFPMLNSNLVHNALNIAMWIMGLLGAIAAYAGCTTLPNGALDCTTSTIIPPSWLPTIVAITTGLAMLKTVINIGRDGLGGLWKPQPPVADATATVTTPIVVAGTKQAEQAAKAEAAKRG